MKQKELQVFTRKKFLQLQDFIIFTIVKIRKKLVKSKKVSSGVK